MAGVSTTSASQRDEPQPSTSKEPSPKRELSESECRFTCKRVKGDPSQEETDDEHKVDGDLLLQLVGRLPPDVHERICIIM